jgi:hypothetical protein
MNLQTILFLIGKKGVFIVKFKKALLLLICSLVLVSSAAEAARPQITTPPQSQSVGEGANATFSVAATGPGLSYRWQFSSSASGEWHNMTATTRTMTINDVQTASNGHRFRCIVTNAAGSVTSNVVTLTVTSPQNAVSTPASQTVNVENSAQTSGLRVVGIPPERRINCSLCNGTGKLTCPPCNGSGRSSTGLPDAPLPPGQGGFFTSLGETLAARPCTRCNGTRQVRCMGNGSNWCWDGKLENPDYIPYLDSLMSLALETGMRIFEVERNQVYRYVGIEWCPSCGGHGWNADRRTGYVSCDACNSTGKLLSFPNSFSDAELRRGVGTVGDIEEKHRIVLEVNLQNQQNRQFLDRVNRENQAILNGWQSIINQSRRNRADATRRHQDSMFQLRLNQSMRDFRRIYGDALPRNMR